MSSCAALFTSPRSSSPGSIIRVIFHFLTSSSSRVRSSACSSHLTSTPLPRPAFHAARSLALSRCVSLIPNQSLPCHCPPRLLFMPIPRASDASINACTAKLLCSPSVVLRSLFTRARTSSHMFLVWFSRRVTLMLCSSRRDPLLFFRCFTLSLHSRTYFFSYVPSLVLSPCHAHALFLPPRSFALLPLFYALSSLAHVFLLICS